MFFRLTLRPLSASAILVIAVPAAAQTFCHAPPISQAEELRLPPFGLAEIFSAFRLEGSCCAARDTYDELRCDDLLQDQCTADVECSDVPLQSPRCDATTPDCGVAGRRADFLPSIPPSPPGTEVPISPKVPNLPLAPEPPVVRENSAPSPLPSERSIPGIVPPPVPMTSTAAPRQIVTTSGNSADARARAAERLARGDAAEAEATLVAALTRSPADAELALTLARLRETREDWAGAAAAYGLVLQTAPNDARWRVRRADCLYHTGNYDAAVAEYRQAAAGRPGSLSPGQCARYGDAALRTGDPATAEAAFTALAARSKQPMPRVELLRGVAALKAGDPDRAQKILTRARSRWPNDKAISDAFRLANATRKRGSSKQIVANLAAPTAPGIVVIAAEELATSSPKPVTTSAGGWHRAATPTLASVWRPARTTVDAFKPEPGEPRLLPQ